MVRAPYQVLIIPFRYARAGLRFAVLKRRGTSMWQFVSGGGEDDELPIQAAEREMREEVSLDVNGQLRALDSTATIPKSVFEDVARWGEDLLVIPEHSYAVDIRDSVLVLSSEHTELRWAAYEQACALLTWDSNRTALWELGERLKRETRQS